MSIFTDSLLADLRSLIKTLEALGVTKENPKTFAAVAEHIEAAEALDALHSHAAKFTAPPVEHADLTARLIAGDHVTDAELIDAAARATSAGGNVGKAAQGIISTAQAARVRAARDTLRGTFETIVDNLKAVLVQGGDQPAPSLVHSINSALKDIDKLAGRGTCDYWIIQNLRTNTWAILDRNAAEELEAANREHLKQKQEAAQRRKDNPPRIQEARKKPSLLSRRPAAFASPGGSLASFDQSDLDAYRAAKASPTLTR